MLATNLLFFILFGALLVVSGYLLVKNLVKIASFLRISEFTAAFIIMAIATSLPELFVGISSAISGNPSLSLGNVIGANILDLTLITGIIILASKGAKIKTKKIGKGLYVMFGLIVLILVLFLIGNSLSRIDGVILLSIFVFNTIRMLKKKEKYKAKIGKNKIKKYEIVASVVIFILALIILFFSSKQMVKYSVNLALDLNLPKIIIGLFLISIATTLPELVFGISATRMKHKEMGIGDQTGTVIANSSLILGLVAIIHPIEAEFTPFLTSGVFMFFAAFIFIKFVKSKESLNKLEGISLILIYLLFIAVQFFLR